MKTLTVPYKDRPSRPTAVDCLPEEVALQVVRGKVVTYNQGRRLVTARKVRHLVVLRSA